MHTCPPLFDLKILTKFYSNTVVGGTFDRLHIAHKGLITLSTEISEHPHICIMSDTWIRSKSLSSFIEPYEVRYRNIVSFLRSTGNFHKSIISKIDDPYSYALDGKYAKILDSIVISNEEKVVSRTMELNEMRLEKGLEPLTILKMPIIRDVKGKPYSSTRIREGDIKLPTRGGILKITEELRESLKEPKGLFYKSVNDLPKPKKCVIAVGDIVTKSLVEHGYPISIAIIDRKSERKTHTGYYFQIDGTSEKIIEVPITIPTFNPQGSLTFEAWYTTMLALMQKKPVIVRVFGEEDLMGFPATILAPEGSYVIYGDPFNRGIVVIEVDEEMKEKAKSDILKMRN
ncbi:MAG: pantetheine-phosphate adenylyltransferase [Candidatus Njordarchaeia archaeon]